MDIGVTESDKDKVQTKEALEASRCGNEGDIESVGDATEMMNPSRDEIEATMHDYAFNT